MREDPPDPDFILFVACLIALIGVVLWIAL